MQIKDLHKIFLSSGKVITDSRIVDKGAIFFALKGENFDGNKYAKKAIENGCTYAIIDNKDYCFGDKYILVDNTLKTLQDLAKYHRLKFNIPVIAITGTNGKTTTKELIANVLNKKYKTCFTKGNFNNHIGLPITLLSFNKETEIAVIEMGANHMGEIKTLCEIAMPNYGIITNIGKAHLEGFGSYENVIKTKKELYDFITLHKETIFYNEENEVLNGIIKNLDVKAIPFNGKNTDVQCNVLPTEKFLTLELYIQNKTSVLRTSLIGNYNMENVLAAITIGHFFHVELKDIKEAIEKYTPKNNRSQYIKTEQNNLFLDAYNANPTSVKAALLNFKSLNLKNKCIILGDMLELGENSLNEHKEILNMALEFNFDKIILVGSIYNSLKLSNNKIFEFITVDDLKQWLLKNTLSNLNILIKGSRGIRLEQVVDYL